MTINSKQKGNRFERDLAKLLNSHGFDCRRGQQFSGIEGDDVVGLDGIHIEAKAVEALNVWKAMEQATRDAKENEYPTVFHKRNYKGILVTMRFDDWIELYKAWVK